MKLKYLILTTVLVLPLIIFSKTTITEANGSLKGLGFARTHTFPVEAEIFTVLVSDPDTSGHRSLKVEASVNDLHTGNVMRDNHMRMSVLDRKKHPLITFQSDFILSELSQGTIQLPGTLQINGISRDYDFEVTLSPASGKWHAKGSFLVVPTDFDLPLVGMGPMKLLDKVELNLDVTF